MGEGPGQNEDQQGRPFVGAAGGLLTELIGSIGWRRDEVFITNVVKCRPPGNRDPEPDEMAACAPFLRRQLEVLDPALVVTLGRFSLGTFMPGARIGQVHGTVTPGRPGDGRPGRGRLRHVSPGRRVPPDGAQGDDARGHGAGSRRCSSRRVRSGRRARPRCDLESVLEAADPVEPEPDARGCAAWSCPTRAAPEAPDPIRRP